jgi:hypothetical protein
MGLTDREDIMIADTPESFAQALIELYQSEELWNRISQNALHQTKRCYSVEAAKRQLRCLLHKASGTGVTVVEPVSKELRPPAVSRNVAV